MNLKINENLTVVNGILTVAKLDEMLPGIFAEGIQDVEDYWNTSETMRVHYVAVRGGIHDWAIYYMLESRQWSSEMIKDQGDKMRNEESIRKCVPCDDKAFELYRY